MIRRFVALAALLFYGSIDRVTGFISDVDYPDDRDGLASRPSGLEAQTVEDRGPAARLLLS